MVVPYNDVALEILCKLVSHIISNSIYDKDASIEYTTDSELIFEKLQNTANIFIDGGYDNIQASTVIDISEKSLAIIR